MMKADSCDNKNWRIDVLEELVEREVKRLLSEPRYLKSILKEKEAETKKKPLDKADVIRGKVAALEKQISRQMDLYSKETIPVDVLSESINKLYREKVALTEQLSALVQTAPVNKRDFNDDSLQRLLADFASAWNGADFEDKRRIISALINRVTIDGDDIKIEWSILDD
jgi:site-specific DNA recombinase